MIFKGSRYTGDDLYIDEDTDTVFIFPDLTRYSSSSEDLVYQFKAGDRLDILAQAIYGDVQKKWLIMRANPIYFLESDIKIGDNLLIPNPDTIREEAGI